MSLAPVLSDKIPDYIVRASDELAPYPFQAVGRMCRLMKRATPAPVVVDGTRYLWHVLREPQWCHEDGYKGMSIHVEPEKNPRRVLILEFPFFIGDRVSNPFRLSRSHQRPKIVERQLVAYISSAIASGWNPLSRGKPFVVQVKN
jgi:hypothetical protein